MIKRHDWLWNNPRIGQRTCQRCGLTLSIRKHIKVGECKGQICPTPTEGLREKIAKKINSKYGIYFWETAGDIPRNKALQTGNQILSLFNQWLEEQDAQAPRFPAEDGLYWGPLRLEGKDA